MQFSIALPDDGGEMENDWQEITRIAFPPPAGAPSSTPVTSLVFDNSQELLWTGNGFGRVTSFYGPELQRYTSFFGHGHHEGAVKQFLLCDKGVFSVGSRSVHLSLRRGLTVWHLRHDTFEDLRCMCFTSKGSSEILVAGCQSTMSRIDMDKGEVVETLPSPDQYTLMKRGGSYICAATATGSVQLLDNKSLEVLKTWKAHSGWINDLDANSSFLVTCGWSPRQHFGNTLDPLAKVFDLKTLMPLPPVPFHAGAAFVRLHPRMQTTAIVGSQNGQIQLVDIMNSSMVTVRQVNLMHDSYLLGLEIAPSGEALVLTDSMCTIQLWGHASKIHFTEYSNPTEFADSSPPERTIMDFGSNAPLSVIGMPYYRETLLSSWPGHLVFEVGSPPAKIDPAIMASLTRAELGGYTRNSRNLRRNQAANTRRDEKIAEIEGPKFLSEQAKDGNGDAEHGRRMSEVLEALTASKVGDSTKSEVPLMYRGVEIKYSKFGVEDFDFEFYNKTRFSGLETDIANSYANSLLQLMKFTPWIRNLALHHTAGPCSFETCLLCEIGFLFDMLEKAEGQNCQATNFLKTFSDLSHTASLGLLEEGGPQRPITLMIQATSRFLLEKIAADFRQMSPKASHMDQALTTLAMNSIRCAHCNNETVRPGGTYVHELVYPQMNQGKNRQSGRVFAPTFSQVLKASVERQDQTRGWCDRCKRYQQLAARKTIQSLPPVLMINAAVHSNDAKKLWSTPRWLPQEIGIIVDHGQFFCYEGQDLQFHLYRGNFNIVVYELMGVVADINSGENQKSHLVSMINVSPSEREPTSENEWYLFNDFLVRQVSGDEALRFYPSWKLPSVLAYQVKSARHQMDDTWKDNLDTSLLYRKWVGQQDEDMSKFRTLTYPAERPQPGTPVGIDAEFVALQQEEIEVKADGSRSVLRPSRLGLARVSVLRGGQCASLDEPPRDENSPPENSNPSAKADPSPWQEYDLVPFIDDYIAISEPIVDYLTQFSGISQGDLSPTTSPHTSSGRLVSLKTAYKKIWLLLNLGCVFIGHGLLKDFRTINIHVPKAQVVDTVDLYYLKNRGRKLSLRFLVWLLLGQTVQVGMHDSIEDASMAVLLWRRWKEFEAEGDVESVLNEIYKRGRDVGFRVPASSEPSGSSAVASGVGTVGTSDVKSTTSSMFARLLDVDAPASSASGRTTPTVSVRGSIESVPGTPWKVKKEYFASDDTGTE